MLTPVPLSLLSSPCCPQSCCLPALLLSRKLGPQPRSRCPGPFPLRAEQISERTATKGRF